MLLAFDDFVYDETRRKLRKANTFLKIDAKLLDLLAYFLRHSGELVTKQELLDQVWEGRSMADSVLSVSVAKLRKALGHKKGHKEYIENVYGRGYRFLLPVTASESKTALSYPPSLPPRGPGAGPLLVGRAPVMQRLDFALEAARAGQGRICMLVGEPGIGKTRVAEALQESSASSGALWAWARCYSMESEPPLRLWTNVLREYLNTPLADEIGKILSERIRELDKLAQNVDQPVAWMDGTAAIGYRTFDEIIQVLKDLSARQPLVLSLDDLQWADAASLRLLSHVVVEIARWPLLVVATLRNTELDPKDSRHKYLRYVLGHRNCERIELGRLNDEAVAEYVTALFGEGDAALSRTAFDKSEGNPFFMAELLRPWIGLRRPRPDELELSSLALDIVHQRLRKLDAETRSALSVASVIGRNFDLNILSYVMDREAGSLLDLLDEPLAGETIVPSLEETGTYAFSHELIREVLYQELTPAERGAWHARAGEALEKRRILGVETADAELARHFLAACPQGDVDKAVLYARRAADEAFRFLAFADASVLLTRALQVVQTAARPDPHLLCSLLLESYSARRALGDSRQVDHLKQAIAIATEHGFGQLLAAAGRLLSVAPGVIGLPDACRVLEAAEKALPQADRQERAIVLAHLAWTPPHCMSARRVGELIGRAETLARESGSSLAAMAVLRAKLYLAAGPANRDEALAVVQQLERLIEANPDLVGMAGVEILVFRIVANMQLGDREAMQKAIDDFGVAVYRLKNVELQWHHRRMVVVQRMNAGDLIETGAALAELREQAETLQLQAWRAVCDLDLGILLKQTADIRPFGAEIRPRFQIDESDSQHTRAMKMRSMVEFGLLEDAETAVRSFPVASLYELPADRDYLSTLVGFSAPAVAVRAMEHAEALYGLLKPYARYFSAGISFHCDGSVSYYLGTLARVLGRTEEAIAHLKEALGHNERFGLEALAARTRYELARALAEGVDPAARKQAYAHLKQTLQEAQRLGLQPLLNDAERWVAELTGR